MATETAMATATVLVTVTATPTLMPTMSINNSNKDDMSGMYHMVVAVAVMSVVGGGARWQW
jgi:hypothetical protein